MANYHFTIKVDRKPDKTAISAASHADYINRDGSFANIDFKRELDTQVRSGCILAPIDKKHMQKSFRNANGRTVKSRFLYRSIYGSIKETSQGIEYTQGASTETMQIALALAKSRYGENLSLTGPINEIASVLRAGQAMDYPVHFSTPAINNSYQKLLEENHHDSRNRNSSPASRYESGRNRTSHTGESGSGTAETIHLPNLEPTSRKRPPAQRTPLRSLLQCNLDANTRNAGMLLPSDHASGLEQSGAQLPDTMRRDFRWGTRRKVDHTAELIWAQADGITPASHHADYINRRDSFAAKGGCIYTHHHLPTWASTPKEFFTAADEYERANGTRYREIEFALPNELTTAAQREIIDTFIEHHLSDHYYAYAIHDKIGAMSNGEHNTHVHIMFCEREIDELEKKACRTPEMFFHRANPKHPERGGCPKSPKWYDKNRAEYLCLMRRDFAEIQNAVLEKYHIETRVDHRSLKDQYEEALKKGDLEAALLLHRLPEEHIGPTRAANKNDPKVLSLMAYRAYKFQRSHLVHMIADMKLQHAAELAQEARANAEDALLSQDIHGQTADLAKLKEAIEADYKTLSAIEKVVISKEQAQEMAMEQLLPHSHFVLLQAQKTLTQNLDELKNLRLQVQTKAASTAAEEIAASLTKEILLKQEQLNAIQQKTTVISAKLDEPEFKEQLERLSKKILWLDKPQKNELWKNMEKLNADTQLLQEEMDKQVLKHIDLLHDGKPDQEFTTMDISKYLQIEIRNLKTAIQRKATELTALQKRLISPERAMLIAKANYLGDKYKDLQEEAGKLKKEGTRIEAAVREYQVAKSAFDALSKPKWYQSSKEYEAESARVAALADTLARRQQEHASKQADLQKMQLAQEAKCNTPEAQAQIAAIATKVLEKDQIKQAKFEKLAASIPKMQDRLQDLLLMQEAIKAEIALTGPVKIHKEKAGGTSARQRMEEYAHSLRHARFHVGNGLAASLHDHDHKDFEAMDEAEKEAQSELSL